MFGNFFITLGRQLWRNRLFTILNIIGLSVCICVAWIVFRMVSYENSFDKKVPEAQSIYQLIIRNKREDGNTGGFAAVSKPVLNALINDVSGAGLVVPMFYKHYNSVTVPTDNGNKKIEEEDDIHQVTTLPDYFDMLDYKWLAGNKKTAFKHPDNVVLTHDRAKKYFPKLSPAEVIGKPLVYSDTLRRTVSGVVADLPYPNSFSRDNTEFMSVSRDDMADQDWASLNSDNLLFIKTGKHGDVKNVVAQLNKINHQHNKESFEKYKYRSWYEALPLKEKHFAVQYGSQTRTADKKVLFGLMITGGFLLLLACINYINLSTALLPRRAKEIGIRKTLGSSARSLIARFVAETFMVTVLAALFSFVLTFFAVRILENFLPVGILDYMNYPAMAGFMLLLVFLISLLSGLYPAWLSSKVNTVEVLKGRTEKVIGRNKITFRKSLIVFQFLIAQVFIIGAIIIGQQLKYMLHKDPGFNKDAVITFSVPYRLADKKEYKDKQFVLRNELLKNTMIKNVSLGDRPMEEMYVGSVYTYFNGKEEVQAQLQMKNVDTAFLNFYGITLLAGNNFKQADTTTSLVINEKALQVLGFGTPQTAIGKQLLVPGSGKIYPIVGVVKDFNQSGMRSDIAPGVFVSDKDRLRTFNIKLPNQPKDWEKAISSIEKEWKKVYAEAPFKYEFYDDTIGAFYKNEMRTQTLVRTATVIAIFISCLGLFGLATFTALQRTKEIGIRKVLGASVSGIIRLLSKDFLFLVFISLVIAVPIGWWLMVKWLQDFAFRIDIGWWMFLFAGALAVMIAAISVSYQAIKAAMANPVKSLRTE
jgi:ABC-type antimicrobial peptide transport system permease subunit